MLRAPAARERAIQDAMEEARRRMRPEWGIGAQPSRGLRLVEVSDFRMRDPSGSNQVIPLPSQGQVDSLGVFGKGNALFHSVRLESGDEPGPTDGPQAVQSVEFIHSDRQSNGGQLFGQPFLMQVQQGELVSRLKQRVKAKLQVPDGEFKTWRWCSQKGTGANAPKQLMKDEDRWDDPRGEARVCLEHSHPCPSQCSGLTRQSRYNKPLTIK